MLFWLMVGCGPDATEALGETLAAFSLVDQNASSETYGQAVSPQDFRGMASAWYFGHAS